MAEKATFAAGCFWGVEDTFHKAPGVISTRVGYTGGHTENPSYQQVCSDKTGHAEAVEVVYDPEQVSYADLLDIFWHCHNPTLMNRQGPDIGTQYRSAIFFHNAEQQQLALASKNQIAARYPDPITTEITAASTFYPAEEYHQMYLAKKKRS